MIEASTIQMPLGVQILLLLALTLYFGWKVYDALWWGTATVYVRYNRDLRFSRRARPMGFWMAVLLYSLLAASCASGIIIVSVLP